MSNEVTVLTCNVASFAIATLYYYWRDVYQAKRLKERVLRQRVAYMLWAVANQMD
ncbi:hypothetical protein [Tuwongella immobilis]|uniref:Uncharacterized protein n=1 Tax=Tuwongella immobilis TaxID=692036 RepID=A0A6C2YNT5_9BACT|nr:hypothetical protein [Tuwongella immobilis]VIP02951.1 unnamed protein product [Tuwongella immobilis]VTS02941.1 unnamed protein product [Tuwongella immobilis]